MDTNPSSLFDPLPLADLVPPNRVIMAPLSRSRSGASRVPNARLAEYYGQRASAGLILSEATANPDLPQRIAIGTTLNSPDQSTFYSGGARGYTDYPSLAVPTIPASAAAVAA